MDKAKPIKDGYLALHIERKGSEIVLVIDKNYTNDKALVRSKMLSPCKGHIVITVNKDRLMMIEGFTVTGLTQREWREVRYNG